MSKDSTRNGFGRGLLKIKSKNVYVLTADLGGSTMTAEFAKKHPKRFVQVGVAEQNLVTVASGLAHLGKIPFCTSFAAFSPGRNLEQIRTTICYNDRPVKICSTHTGLGVGEDGATHQALEDLALMRTLPNMVVIQPCDAIQAEKATVAIAKLNKPCYLRLNRQKVDTVTSVDDEFVIGKADVLKKGSKVTILAIGPMVSEVYKLKDDKELDAEIINVHTLKPLDEKTIIKSAKKTGLVVTVEDHQINGGLAGAVAEILSEKLPTKMLRLGVKDEFGESGPSEELFEKHRLTHDLILEDIKKFALVNKQK